MANEAIPNAAGKAKLITVALATLAREYDSSECAAERACAKTVRRVMMDLPSYSKARLYDILKSVEVR